MKMKYKYNVCQNGHKTNIQDVIYLKYKKKYIKYLVHPLTYEDSPYLLNYPSLYEYDYSYLKLLSLFVTSDKGVSTSSRHLIIIRRVIIIILSIINTIGAITLILRCLEKGSHCVTIHHNLSLCNMIDTGVHLTQLIAESVKASIHAHKLCHVGLKCDSTHQRRRRRGGWSNRSRRSCRLRLGCLEQSCTKLCLMVAASMAHINKKLGNSG